ncbi:DUF6056 family protein [Fructobacillus durionis]|uniref:Glucosyl transferase GtrII n=1 Tax=Fructobacillus durionis TaxID=283737 RepID=A0A1I1E2I4_9LACO|nr:DUF6056 family protein [Fructobacillus durionis]SFB81391.1 hypothetical protein SAMN05660453_0262 [Fructobacillus durionis]
MSMLKTIKNKKIILISIILFVITLIPNLLIPFVSDDVSFALVTGEHGFIRNLVSMSYHFYFDWSGRLLTDFESRVLLQFPHFFVALFKSAALVLLIFLIAQLPSNVFKKKNISAFSFVFIFIVYWICNPNLGQTTFWTVGASNYLFTNVWILVYLNLAFYTDFRTKNIIKKILYFLVAFAAGLSNENTAPVVVLLSLGLVIYNFLKTKHYSFNWITGTLFSVIGASVLILAPGNSIRQEISSPIFKQESLFVKIHDFFVNGVFTYSFSNYGFFFLIFTLILIAAFLFNKSDRKAMSWTIIFGAMGILSNALFTFSPEIPQRALQGAFVFFLVSMSFAINQLLSAEVTSKIEKVSISILFLPLLVFFVLSYSLEVHSFNLAGKESAIRIHLMKEAAKNHSGSVNIPSWYIGRVLRPNNDPYDRYFNHKIGQYYGYYGYVHEVRAHFDYTDSKLLSKTQFAVRDNPVFSKINIYNDDENLNRKTVVLFLKDDANNIQNGKLKLVTDHGEKQLDFSSLDILSINGYKFISVDIDKFLYKNSLREIDVNYENNGKVGKEIQVHDIK